MSIFLKNQLDKSIQVGVGLLTYNLKPEQEVAINPQHGDYMYIDPLNQGNVATEITAGNLWSLLVTLTDGACRHLGMDIDEAMSDMTFSEFLDYMGSINKDKIIQLTVTKPKKYK